MHKQTTMQKKLLVRSKFMTKLNKKQFKNIKQNFKHETLIKTYT